MVAKFQLDEALEAWCVAKDKALHANQAFALVLQSHSEFIDSLRTNGHTFSQAEAEFAHLSKYHSDTLLAAWKNMDVLCGEYLALLKKYNEQ